MILDIRSFDYDRSSSIAMVTNKTITRLERAKMSRKGTINHILDLFLKGMLIYVYIRSNHSSPRLELGSLINSNAYKYTEPLQ
jgi:hypothetical protein